MDNPEDCVDLTDDTSNPGQEDGEEEGMEFTDMMEWDVLDETSDSDNEDGRKNEDNIIIEDDSDEIVVVEKKSEEVLHSDVDTADVPSDSIKEAKPKDVLDNVVDENQGDTPKQESTINDTETGDKDESVNKSEDDIKDTQELQTDKEPALDVVATDANASEKEVSPEVSDESKHDDKDSPSTLLSEEVSTKTETKHQDSDTLVKDQVLGEKDTSVEEDAGVTEVAAPKSRRQPARAAASRRGKRMTTRSSSSKIAESTKSSDSVEVEEEDTTKLPVEEDDVPKPAVSPEKAAAGRRGTRSKAGKTSEDKSPADDSDISLGIVVVDVKSTQPDTNPDDKKAETPVKTVGRKRGGKAAAKPAVISEKSEEVNNDVTDTQSIEKMETGTTESDEAKISECEDVVMPAPDVEASENIPSETNTEKSELTLEENSQQTETAVDNKVSLRPTTGKSPTKMSAVKEEEVIVIESNSEGESGDHQDSNMEETTGGVKSDDQPQDLQNKETAEDVKVKTEIKIKKEPLQEQVELDFGHCPALKKAPVEVKLLDMEVSDLTKEEVILAFRHSQSFHIDFPNRPEKPGMATMTYWLCNVSRQKIICKTLAKLKNRGLNLVSPKIISGMIKTFEKSSSKEKSVPGRGTFFSVKSSKFQTQRKTFDAKFNPKVQTGINPIERSMYVDNIPQTTNERKLKELFPTAKRACIPRKPGGSLLGWAVMEFPDKSTMLDAIENNKDLKINDNKIVLSKIKKGQNKIPDTPRMNLWLWGIKSPEAFRGKRQFDKFQNRNQTRQRNTLFGRNAGLGPNRRGMAGSNMNRNMGGLNMGPNMGNMMGQGLGHNRMGQGMGGPMMSPNMSGANMGPNMGGPNMGPNMGGPNMRPNMGGPNMGPNIGGPNMGPNMGGQNMGLNMGGQGMSSNLGGRNMGPNVGIGPNMSGAGMGPNVSGSSPNMSGGQNFGGSGNMPNMGQGLKLQSSPENTQRSPLSPRGSHFSEAGGMGGRQQGRGRQRDKSFQHRSRFDSRSSDRGSRFSQERDFESGRSPDFDRRSRFDDDRNQDLARSRSREREQMYDRGSLDYDRNRDFDRNLDYDRNRDIDRDLDYDRNRDFDRDINYDRDRDIDRDTDFQRRQRERDRSRSFDRGSDRNLDTGYGGKSLGAADRSRDRDRPGRSQYGRQSSTSKRQRKISTEEIVSSPESDLGLDYRGRKDTTVLQKNLSEKLGVVLSNERHGVQDDRAMVVLLQTALNAMQKTSSPSPERSPPRSKPVRKPSPSPRRQTSTSTKRKNPFPQQHEQQKRRLTEEDKFDSPSGDAGWRSGGFHKQAGRGGTGRSTSQRGFARGGRQQGASGRGAGNRGNNRGAGNRGNNRGAGNRGNNRGTGNRNNNRGAGNRGNNKDNFSNRQRGFGGRGKGNMGRGGGASKFQNQGNRMGPAQTDVYRPQTSSDSYDSYRPLASTQQQQMGGQQGMSSGYGRQQYNQPTFQASQSYTSPTMNYNQGQGQQRY